MPTIQFFQPHEGRRWDGPLDLNEHLVRHPAATFFMRAGEVVAHDLDVREGDLLVIDRSLHPAPGRVAIVVRGGELRVERLRPPTGEDEDADLWGIVTHLIRDLA
jgi:DNA polymerase V